MTGAVELHVRRVSGEGRRCWQRLSQQRLEPLDFAIGCRHRGSKLRLCHKSFQSIDISAIVSRLLDRRLGNERRMRQAKIVEQHSESLFADRSLPDLLMPVEFRSARSFRVITVPDLDVIQPDRGIKMLQRFSRVRLR